MAKKNINWDKFKALAPQILECIGEDSEGENPELPKQDNAVNDGGAEANTAFLKTPESDETETGVGKSKDKKKKNDASLAVMSSMLANKLGKSAVN